MNLFTNCYGHSSAIKAFIFISLFILEVRSWHGHANSGRRWELWNAFSWYSIFCLRLCDLRSAFKANLNFESESDSDSRVICGHFARRHFIYHLRWSWSAASGSAWVSVSVSRGSLDLDGRFRDEPEIGRGGPGDHTQKHFAARINIYFCGFRPEFGSAFVSPAFGLINDARRDNDACMPGPRLLHNTQMLSASDPALPEPEPLLSVLGAVALPQNARNGVKHD